MNVHSEMHQRSRRHIYFHFLTICVSYSSKSNGTTMGLWMCSGDIKALASESLMLTLRSAPIL